MAELRKVAGESPSLELFELLQRAVGHVVKTIMRADDSSGLIGSLAEELLASHAVACDAGVADPVRLAGWMVRFRFKDQDFFEPDPVRYRAALGPAGLQAYRDAVASYSVKPRSTAAFQFRATWPSWSKPSYVGAVRLR